jgi:protein TonB
MVLAVLALGGFLAWQTDPGRDFLQRALAGLQGGVNSVTKSAEANTPAPTTSTAPSTVTAKTPTPEVTSTPSETASVNPASPPAADSAPAVSSPPPDAPVAKRTPKRAVEEVETLGEQPPRSHEPFVDTSVARVPAATMAANLLTSRAPVYPELARTLQIQGPVTLEILVTSTGAVRYAQMIDGDRRLAVAAQEAVRRWRYKPYLLNGEPVDVTTTVRLDFRLPDE